MAKALEHRGPDDSGYFEDAVSGLALGHRRLSIIDLSPAGHQPMKNEDGSVVLVFNGEIYNFRSLREELEQKGHLFRSSTDSEVLVHGWEEWGEALLDRICGMFAFALWDARARRIFLARDPMGMKPLYIWRRPGGAVFFASELKAFLRLPGFVAEADGEGIRQFLEFGFIWEEERTSLAGVTRLPAGTHMSLFLRGASAVEESRLTRYFVPPLPAAGESGTTGSHEDLDARADELHDVMDLVVSQHLVADVPVGLLLSGGLDSSVIAALASRRSKVRTISMAFGESEVDERPYARLVAKHIGSEHEEVLIDPAEMIADLERAVYYVDDLFGDWGVISTRLLYSRCRQAGVKVVLVGEGSDELFGGYPDFVRAGSPDVDSLPLSLRTLRLYRYFSGRRWGWGLRRFGLLLRDLAKRTGEDHFSLVRLFETRYQLPGCYNMKVDKASMAASVEARVPFLDVRVARIGYQTPRGSLLRKGTNKYLLRRMAERHHLLPSEVIQRPKYGASMAASWMENVPGFRAFARATVLDPRGWTRTLGLERPMSEFFDKNRPGFRFPHPLSILSIVAWRLLMLNLWARSYTQAGGTMQDGEGDG